MGLSRRGRRRIAGTCVVLVGIAIAGGVVVLVLGWAVGRRADGARDEGLNAWRARDYATAVPKLRRARNHLGDDVELLMALAGSLESIPTANRRDLTNAVECYEAVIQIDDANSDASQSSVAVVVSVCCARRWSMRRRASPNPDNPS